MALSAQAEGDTPDVFADVKFGVQIGCCRSAGGNQSCRWSYNTTRSLGVSSQDLGYMAR